MSEKSHARQHTFGMQMRTNGLHISRACERMKMLGKPLHDFRHCAEISVVGNFGQIAEGGRNGARGFEAHVLSSHGLPQVKPFLNVRCHWDPFRTTRETRAPQVVLE